MKKGVKTAKDKIKTDKFIEKFRDNPPELFKPKKPKFERMPFPVPEGLGPRPKKKKKQPTPKKKRKIKIYLLMAEKQKSLACYQLKLV